MNTNRSVLDDAASQSEVAQDRRPSDASLSLRSAPGAPAPCAEKSDRQLIEALMSSKLVATYQRAFAEATGLPVVLRSVEPRQLPHRGRPNEGRLCALMAENHRAVRLVCRCRPRPWKRPHLNREP